MPKKKNIRPLDFGTQYKVGKKARGRAFALGLWDFNDKSSAFVVFDDDDGERKGFLLGGWRGRPGYTRIPLSDVEDCKFVAKVAIAPTEYANFSSVMAIVGKLVIKAGRALLTTVNENGEIALAPIAPLHDPALPDEECHYSWTLVDSDSHDSEHPGFYCGHGHSSWLNFWISPEYERDEFGCPFCDQDFPEEEDPKE